ncbi:DUF5949 family protein [Streptomyces kanamyceticus]|uniref:Uncharacterized protein n=1 Tax=Streptomyces kanamyceticus TaxID=1967 RepID=A0A5J6GEF8_STRKN|nr:DUF5949 family protein [Streptomyces kanamyceticus]QEU94290.1 hypothetical protein CP970_28330 [Streptomyces kanamyceticus]
MTSTTSEQRPLHAADLGTLAVIAWSGEHPEDQKDMPFLLAYSLGDTEGGPESTAEALTTLLANAGLPIGGPVVDGSRAPSMPVSLLVEADQAVVTMPHVNAQCAVPPEWLAAVKQRGHAYFMVTTRAWPEGKPGQQVGEEQLGEFAGDEETLLNAAHCLLPARSLRA